MNNPNKQTFIGNNNKNLNLNNSTSNTSNLSSNNYNNSLSNVNNIVNEEKELMRFGHSINLVNKNYAILYAGAKGQSSNYDICDDCYAFKIDEKIWTKLNPYGTIPCSRAAHTACSPENGKLYVYGGAIQNGGLAPDIIHCLDITNGLNNCSWSDLKYKNGNSPGQRYGHAMTFYNQNIFIFGGNNGKEITNDIWMINVDDVNPEWIKIDQKGDQPEPRMYHTFSTCLYGQAKGMLIVFGGRDTSNQPRNDLWGFRRHRDGRWDWTKAPEYNSFSPLKRFQVRNIFLLSIHQYFFTIF